MAGGMVDFDELNTSRHLLQVELWSWLVPEECEEAPGPTSNAHDR